MPVIAAASLGIVAAMFLMILRDLNPLQFIILGFVIFNIVLRMLKGYN